MAGAATRSATANSRTAPARPSHTSPLSVVGEGLPLPASTRAQFQVM